MEINRKKHKPGVIRSREHLVSHGAQFLPAGAVPPTPLPITADGVTYNMAQEVAWVDARHFAVGRWDGSLSIFAFNDSPTRGPVIHKTVNTPAFEGVQMITWLAPGRFCSSNDDRSMTVWTSSSGEWSDTREIGTMEYDLALGAANSGDSLVLGSRLYFAAGHANGFVSIWEGEVDGSVLRLVQVIDVRNDNPTNPWNIHNVRGIATIGHEEDGYIVTGSEDGYLCLLHLPDGKVLSRTVYNPNAKRGINSVAAFGQNVLVANCAVGNDDKNLWYYSIDTNDWSVNLKDSVNLRVNQSAPQVFNFCAIWGWSDRAPCFFSSTEEGALWMGTIGSNQQLKILGYETIHGNLGSALAFNANGYLVAVNYDLYEYRTRMPSDLSVDRTGHPERLMHM